MAPKKSSSTQNATLQSMGMDVIKQYPGPLTVSRAVKVDVPGKHFPQLTGAEQNASYTCLSNVFEGRSAMLSLSAAEYRRSLRVGRASANLPPLLPRQRPLLPRQRPRRLRRPRPARSQPRGSRVRSDRRCERQTMPRLLQSGASRG